MNKILFISGLLCFMLLSVQLNAQQQRVIKDVVLLNVEPYEVLMTEEGNIITKVRHLPNYLNSLELIEDQKVETGIVARSSEERIIPGEVALVKEKYSPETRSDDQDIPVIDKPAAPLFEDHYEVSFTKGTATLSDRAITTLNELANILNQNPEQKIQVFGFKNEEPMVASLLAKRRQDACIAYLRIKGVNIESQITKGSVTDGTSNKIVFGFE